MSITVCPRESTSFSATLNPANRPARSHQLVVDGRRNPEFGNAAEPASQTRTESSERPAVSAAVRDIERQA